MRKTVYIALMAFSLFGLAACSEPKKEEGKERPQSTGEVMRGYADTLATSKRKAEDVQKTADAYGAEQARQVKEMDKQ